jgi:hypothetical protein
MNLLKYLEPSFKSGLEGMSLSAGIECREGSALEVARYEGAKL